MQQRKSGNGRPSGTDGSDFSYRMVVDSRYTKVAQGKSCLAALNFVQERWVKPGTTIRKPSNLGAPGFEWLKAVVQLLGVLNLFHSTSKEKNLDKVAVSSTFICLISLNIGELGRKCSRVNILKFYMFVSSIGMLLTIASVLRSNLSVKVIQDLSGWETKKFELFKTASVPVGILLQIISISTTFSLIHNMSPPTRAS